MSFTKVILDQKTVAELREMCAYELDISGMWKKRKDEIIDAILAKTKKVEPAVKKSVGKGGVIKKSIPSVVDDVSIVGGSFTSEITRPDAALGERISTTIRVSCGASSGDFMVVGKSVGAVGEFLREVLNVEKLASGLVNGSSVEDDYILRSGDQLEFLKPAGRKG